MDGLDVLWHASLPGLPLSERLDLAARAGFRGVSITAADLGAVSSDARRSIGDLSAVAGASEVALTCLDSVIEWYPHETPRRMADAAVQDVDRLLDDCARLGVPSVSALAMFPSLCSFTDLVGHFAALCERAGERGLSVHLEFTPFPPIAGLREGWEVVRQSDRANAGVLVDTWHFFHSGADLELLAAIPGDRITAVQLSDGAPHLVESLLKDTFRHRLLPGEGSFDLQSVVDILRRRGGPRLVGPEVLSEELLEAAADETVVRLAAAARRVCSPRPVE